MNGYLQELANQTGNNDPLTFWREIRRSINAPILEHIKRVQGEMGGEQ
jgi:hypothetical protein